MTTLTHLGISCRSLSNGLLTFLEGRIPVRVKLFSRSKETGREWRTRHAPSLLGLIISGGQEQKMKDSCGRGGKRHGGGHRKDGKERGEGEMVGADGQRDRQTD